MRTLIEGYPSRPGEHCGSVAMRSLLQHYCGLDLPEPAVFGLGSGAAILFLRGPVMDPSPVLFGRPGTLEVDVASALGVDYREQVQPDDARAWQEVREEVRAGRPTMLSGDIFYLDYREFKVHFPAHRFVLLGFDDERAEAYIADRIRPEPEVCSLRALAASRNAPEGISSQNLWGRFHDTSVGRTLVDAVRVALARSVEGMLGTRAGSEGIVSSEHVVTGVAGIRAFAESLPGWADREDSAWLASFNARCIEKFGNGGGNFRRLYAGFLSWARALDAKLVPAPAPGLALRAADGWTALSETLGEASAEVADAATLFSRAAAQAAALAELERELFERLAA